MAAYLNADWAECYDLWVHWLFGDGPAEDIPVFAHLLQDIAEMKPPGAPITIVDLGTGSGRVLIDLQAAMQKIRGRKFELWGVEPSAPMLDRAKKLWDAAVEEKMKEDPGAENAWNNDKVHIHWRKCSATDFASNIGRQLGQGADLIIFAAGGFAHVTDNADIQTFLGQVRKALAPDGIAIISFLREHLPESDDNTFATHGAHATDPNSQLKALLSKPQRIPSEEHEGWVYIKHPSTAKMRRTPGPWYEGIVTETFKLDIEHATKGTLMRSQELSWDAKILDRLTMLEWIRKEGLTMERGMEGELQLWWTLKQHN